ncbi:SNF2 family N-terminal domain-containing protein, partial [Dimargaris cristalligena]
LAQKQIPKVYRHLSLNQAVRQQNCRRVAQICQRELRRVATKSAKERKEMQLRSKRAMREMLLFWKRNEKEEKEARKRAEREAQERMRIEEERRESMRQNRKLNFLISQTELFSHFVGNKLGTGDDPGPATTDAAALAEKSTADGAVDFEQIDFDDEDETNLQKRAMQSAQSALALQQRQMKAFDDNRQELRSSALKEAEADHKAGMAVSQDLLDEMNFMNPSSMLGQNEIKQPKLLMCQLKEYQLKGLNWLANLYDQGINGILADEMGLGKTVQSISLLAYLAEVHHIQGPFLVVAPASTLHNWQQEISRFVPAFKILPYWGNVKDRKTLRKLWNKNTLYSSDPPFNVLITSYQMVVTDERYFQRVKWQYMVLDEAQAIKSSSSTRWKILLGFHCRNRLLLTGTPIQNSMQELWALLHFIMPTLFDSHEEFSEWFSKDIESHAENKTSLNQHQLSRLHIILKPFMLRRIKKHVQNELGDKIELEVRCNLTARQRYLYQALKSRISAAELLAKASSSSESDSDSLMNLVMQFRKVCNHPELFERAEVESPYAFCTFSLTPSVAREGDFLTLSYVSRNFIQYHIPRRLYADGGLLGEAGPGSSAAILTKLRSVKLNIWQPDYIQGSIEGNGAFAFAPYVDHSPQELTRAFHNSLWERWVETLPRLHARENWFRYVVDHPELAFHRPRVRLMMPLPGLASPTIADLRSIVATALPYHFLNRTSPAYQPPVVAPPINAVCSSWSFTRRQAHTWFEPHLCRALLEPPCSRWESSPRPNATLPYRRQGLSHIWMPAADKLISYSAKMTVLDKLLAKLKSEGHRVLVYFQMTKMIDLMEEYLTYRQYTYLRLDGSSKISERRDMVTDWQTRDDIFIFLLSTRAGGLGINLTAADTVIFYDSDWNPTVDQQAMDRAHRLGQTRQVTVYRLLTRGTIEEKILMRARQKDEIHKVVISGG